MTDNPGRVGNPSGHRRVLMIAAAFPPTGGPGVQRSAKFAKHLSRFGWQPMVWTVDRIDNLPQDETLLAELPGDVRVYRFPDRGLSQAARRSLRRTARRGGLLSKVAQAAEWRLAARSERGSYPDDCAGWARNSIGPVCQLVHDECVDVLYSTFSPASDHVLAMAVKQETGLPWVADFRDLWIDDYRYAVHDEDRRAADRQLEQEILEQADAVIGVSARQTEILASHVPDTSRKFVTITNGFDPDDFREAPPSVVDKKDTFVLAHVGRFDRWRTPDVWFAGLQRFAERLGSDRKCFELRVVGHIDAQTQAKIEAARVNHTCAGHVSHEQAIVEMESADALLLNLPDGPNADSVIPAKLFEYLAAGRPVIAIGPRDGQAEQVVRSCDAGVTANFHPEQIAAALGRVFSAWYLREPLAGCEQSCLIPYDRIRLAGKLAAILDRAVNNAGSQIQMEKVPAEVGMR